MTTVRQRHERKETLTRDWREREQRGGAEESIKTAGGRPPMKRKTFQRRTVSRKAAARATEHVARCRVLCGHRDCGTVVPDSRCRQPRRLHLSVHEKLQGRRHREPTTTTPSPFRAPRNRGLRDKQVCGSSLQTQTVWVQIEYPFRAADPSAVLEL